MSVEVRTLASSEYRVYAELRIEAMRDEPENFSSSSTENSDEYEELLGTDDLFVATVDDETVALCGLTRTSGNIWGVYVRPAFRKRGIAKQILTYVIQQGGRTLSVNEGNVAAITLYKNLGFRKTRDIQWTNGILANTMTID